MDNTLIIKAATRDAIAASGGSNRAASVTRGTASRFSEYGSPACPDRVIPLDIAMALDIESGAHTHLRAMADVAGFDLVPHNPSTEVGNIKHQVSEAVRGFGNLLADVNTALEDGRIDHMEAAKLEKLFQPEIDRLQSMFASVRKATIKAVA